MWQSWVVGAVVGSATSMMGSVFQLATWQVLVLILVHCTAIVNGTVRCANNEGEK